MSSLQCGCSVIESAFSPVCSALSPVQCVMAAQRTVALWHYTSFDSITVSVFVDILEFDTYRQIVVQIGASGVNRCTGLQGRNNPVHCCSEVVSSSEVIALAELSLETGAARSTWGQNQPNVKAD